VLAVVLFGLGALLLRPVNERRREDLPGPAVETGLDAVATAG
jgi:hypothetical protein